MRRLPSVSRDTSHREGHGADQKTRPYYVLWSGAHAQGDTCGGGPCAKPATVDVLICYGGVSVIALCAACFDQTLRALGGWT